MSKDSPTLVFSSAAYAQAIAVTDQEVTKYAEAVLAMEPLRQSAYREIKKIIQPSNVPEIVCARPESISTLPPEAQAIAHNFCSQSSAIVTNYFPKGKTTRFNEITNLMQTDQGLQERIQSELRRLQQ